MRMVWVIGIVLPVLLCPARSSQAEIPDLTWEEAQIVDAPVQSVSSASGISILFWRGQWRVVYEKSGEIYYCARDESGWLAPVRLSNGAVGARSPHLAGDEDRLHVVWEDARTGHPEVWTRRFNGTSWSTEACVRCDAVASRSPVIAAESGLVILAWEDSSATGFEVWASFFEYGGWNPPDEMSTNAADAREPTVAITPGWGWTFVAWTDYRHGDPEIYMRDSYGDDWFAEQRVTNLTEACRRPSAHTEMCCGDAINETPFVAFEATGASGVTETWVAAGWDFYQVERLSADDGVQSIRPNASGFSFSTYQCGWGGAMAEYFVTWTDVTAPGNGSHQLAYMQYYGPPAEQETLPGVGLSHSAVGAFEGSPLASVMVVWVEDREGVPTLMSRRGSLIGCFVAEMQIPPTLLLTPGGTPANYLRMVDTCTGNPLQGVEVELMFDAALDNALTWDPLQDHPLIEAQTNEDGYAVFPIRGGGCSQAGSVTVMCNWMVENGWAGAKSPDFDGDCWVAFDDLLYIQTRLGTADFCADLDGSGLVDETDVAIVSAAYGSHCSDVDAIDEQTPIAGEFSIRPLPNPARYATSLRIALPAANSVQVKIVDAGGRLVRDFGWQDLPTGSTAILWDLRDDAGRNVSSGVYFAVARTQGTSLRRPVLVMR